MTTRDRGSQIRTALEHLLALPERPRVIVVDNGSSDKTVERAGGLSPLIDVVPLGRNLGGAGRNIGVSRAETPYVAFSDDDSWWAPGALARAADLFDANPTLGLIAARMLVGPEERLDPVSHAMATSPLAHNRENNPSAVGVPIVGFVACGAVARRQAFLEAGGFEQRFGVGGEEQVLALDLLHNGWRLAYVDGIIAHHHPSPIRDVAKRQRLEVRNALWAAWLRRPAASALAATGRIFASSLTDQQHRAGLVEAMLGLPWILAARDPIPATIDHQIKIVEAAPHGGNSL